MDTYLSLLPRDIINLTKEYTEPRIEIVKSDNDVKFTVHTSTFVYSFVLNYNDLLGGKVGIEKVVDKFISNSKELQIGRLSTTSDSMLEWVSQNLVIGFWGLDKLTFKANLEQKFAMILIDLLQLDITYKPRFIEVKEEPVLMHMKLEYKPGTGSIWAKLLIKTESIQYKLSLDIQSHNLLDIYRSSKSKVLFGMSDRREVSIVKTETQIKIIIGTDKELTLYSEAKNEFEQRIKEILEQQKLI